MRDFRARSHDNDDALGIRRADVVEQMILAALRPGELVHGILHDGRASQVERIDGFARLEKNVGILGRAAEHGMIGRQRAGAMGGAYFSSIIARMSSSVSCSILATSCEVRKPSKKCTNGTRASSVAACAISAKSMTSCTELEASMRESGGPRGHHVAVIAENGERLAGQRPRGDVENGRGQLARDLVHVRDHEQQALRRRERGGKAPVCSAPWTAPAAPPSLCISITVGTVPQMFGFCSADHWSAHSPMLDEGVIG